MKIMKKNIKPIKEFIQVTLTVMNLTFILYLSFSLLIKKHFLITKHTKDEGDDLIKKNKIK